MEAQDHMNLASDKAFTKLLSPSESLLISCKVIKFNKRNRAQERTLVVTSLAVLNLKSKRMKRRIEMKSIAGVTRSRNGDEFIVHIPEEYDYRFSSPLKDNIIQVLSKSFRETTGKTLWLWETDEINLKELATSKSDKKKNVSKIPRPEAAINYKKPGIEEEKTESRTQRSTTIFAAQDNSPTVTLNDFTILKVLGRGSFGKVMLVQKNDTKGLFAMKSLRKDALLEREQVEHTRTEKSIMQHINYPFIVKLEYAFSTNDKIYFVMAYMRGGELFHHLKEARKFSEDRARFYGAQIALALGHLHEQNIVYRDLKPENILMDDEGNVNLTDFGMAKFLKEGGSTQSFVGTPEYLAPEIIACSGHGLSADWWSFGILLYEMMVGIPPFYNQNIQLMYELIQHGDLRFPQRSPLSPQAQDIITKLLDRDAQRRIGGRGIQDIRTHPFFEGIDWAQLEAKQLPPPFVPSISAPTSTDYFDEEFTSEDPVNSVVPEHKMKMVMQHQDQFSGF